MTGYHDNLTRRGDVEQRISHFIPSVQLEGTREQKLRTLDTLIAYLEQLRRALAGDRELTINRYDGPSPHASSPAWPWFGGGIALTAAIVLTFVLAARGWF